jgi:anaerobic selenocysteine-containing dehydrogenase
MVIANAHAGDPYPVDLLFLYMANMAWNSSMNTAGVIRMLEDKDPATGEYRIPKIIYADAYASEMVAYADLVLPDTTYLERHDCISLLDRPISEPDAVQDAIRWPVVTPDRDVRPFQSVLIDLAGRLKLNGFVDSRGKSIYRDYADYIVRHERRPGIGPLAGFRGANGDRAGRGATNPRQLERYVENGSFFSAHIPLEAQFFKHANKAYQDFAVRMGFFDQPQPVTFQLYQEALQKFRLSAQGVREPLAPESHRGRILETFDPLPDWYRPLEEASVDRASYPLHAVTQRPAAMYHSWGSMNAWLRQIHTRNVLYVPGNICLELGLADGDWVEVISHHGRIKVEIARTDAVNGSTVWTWNGIGKRKGTWGLDTDVPEAQKGFLLNHLIHELLPPKGDGHRWSNSDPITGQAAWYDLRVRIEKVTHAAASAPSFPHVGKPGQARERPEELRYGQEWAT